MEAVQDNNFEVIKPRERDSNLELFRIVAMIFIIMHHYVVNSGLMDVMQANPTSIQSIFLLLFGGWGKIGINCFVLITGYFMCKSKITLKKFIKLFCEIYFYKIIIGSIFLATGYTELNFKEIIKILIPIRIIDLNFSSCFIIFYLFIPFINILINNLNQRKHIYLILLSFFVYVILGTIPGFNITFNYVGWFIVLYFISSYIRFYPKKSFDSWKIWLITSIIFIVLSAGSIIAMTYAGVKFNFFKPYYFVTDSNTLLALGTGLSLFMLFKNIKIKKSRIINSVSETTFGVLLIHANCDAMRQFLWVDSCQNVNFYSSSLLVLHAFGCVLAIFIVCSLIDTIRIYAIQNPLLKLFDKHAHKIVSWYNRLEDKIFGKFYIQ